MEYKFKRDLKNSFMIVDTKFSDMGYEKEILKNNDIGVLVPFHTLDINNKTEVWYDITGLVSLHDYLLQQGITIELMRKVLLYLKIAIDEVERYLIDTNHLVIDVDTIYVVKNNNDWKLMLIYYPNESSDVSVDNILEFFMNNADKESMDIAFELYDTAGLGTSIDGLIQLIDEKCNEELTNPKAYEAPSVDNYNKSETQHIVSDTAGEREPGDDLYEDFWDEERAFVEIMNGGAKETTLLDKIVDCFKKYFADKKGILNYTKGHNHTKGHKKKNEEALEDFVFEPDQEIYEPTVLLKSIEQEKKGYELQYTGSNKQDNIRLLKDELTLGSAKEGTDTIIDSPVISRFHAKITKEGTDYYLQDLNSTNGTSVNGKLLGYRDKVKLNPNDEIMFANESYRFV